MDPIIGRTVIWNGILEYFDKNNLTNDGQRRVYQIPCQTLASTKNGEPEVNAQSWPSKLIMQLMPKVLVGSIGQAFLKNSQSVVFLPTPCKALDLLTELMTFGFAGCIHFSATPNCNIKVMVLLFVNEKKTFIGFIPNNQQEFVKRLKAIIQELKKNLTMNRVEVMPQPSNQFPDFTAYNHMLQSNAMSSSWHQPQEPSAATSSNQSFLDFQAGEINSFFDTNSQKNTSEQQQPMRSLGEANFNQTVKVEPEAAMDFQSNGALQQENSGITRQENLEKIQRLMEACQAAQTNLADAWNNLTKLQQDLKNAQNLDLQFRQSDLNLNFFHP